MWWKLGLRILNFIYVDFFSSKYFATHSCDQNSAIGTGVQVEIVFIILSVQKKI